jgi:hypothetical protein
MIKLLIVIVIIWKFYFHILQFDFNDIVNFLVKFGSFLKYYLIYIFIKVFILFYK